MLGRLLTLYILWKCWAGVRKLQEAERRGQLWRRSYERAPDYYFDDCLKMWRRA